MIMRYPIGLKRLAKCTTLLSERERLDEMYVKLHVLWLFSNSEPVIQERQMSRITTIEIKYLRRVVCMK